MQLDPRSWRDEQLDTLTPNEIHELMGVAVGAGVVNRLLIGRILINVQKRELYTLHGCWGIKHYAVRAWRLEISEAKACARVARRLRSLPLLTEAAEKGLLDWGSLRRVVMYATPDDEAAWLRLAQKCTQRELSAVIRRYRAKLGETTRVAHKVKIEWLVERETMALVQRAVRCLCERAGRLMPLEEVLQYMAAETINCAEAPDEKRLERLLKEAGRDAAAEEAAPFVRPEVEEQVGLFEGAPADPRPYGDYEPGWGEERPDEFDWDKWNADEERRAQRARRQAAQVGGLSELAVSEAPHAAVVELCDVDAGSKAAGQPLAVTVEAARQDPQPPKPVRYDEPTRPIFGWHFGGADCARDKRVPYEPIPVFNAPWATLAAEEVPCPSNGRITLVSAAKVPHWRNGRLHWNAAARLVTEAQGLELTRRDGFACSVPHCPNTLWLTAHHIVFYCDGGPTVPGNLVMICSACHRALHRGVLHVTGTAPHGLRWTDQSGQSLHGYVPYPPAEWLRAWYAPPARERPVWEWDPPEDPESQERVAVLANQ